MVSAPDKINELSMLDTNDRSMSPDYSQDILYRLTVQIECFDHLVTNSNDYMIL